MLRRVVPGAAVSVVALAYLAVAFRIPTGVARSEAAMEPRTFPLLVGVALLLAGIGLVLQAGLSRPVLGEVEADSAGTDRGDTEPAPNARGMLIFLLASGVYLVLLEPLGFVIATSLYMVVSVFIIWGRRPTAWRGLVGPVVFAILTAGLTYYVFAVVLNLNLPSGPLL